VPHGVHNAGCRLKFPEKLAQLGSQLGDCAATSIEDKCGMTRKN
jgi:hypothetical protein